MKYRCFWMLMRWRQILIVYQIMKFSVAIGKRVLTHDLVLQDGIPVYSANVLELLVNIDKSLIEDFSIPSILWGIDGDWMLIISLKTSHFIRLIIAECLEC